jgi:hypothetical protein
MTALPRIFSDLLKTDGNTLWYDEQVTASTQTCMTEILKGRSLRGERQRVCLHRACPAETVISRMLLIPLATDLTGA